MEQNLDVDNLWRSLGPWGKYQLGQLAIMWMAMVPCSIHLLAVVFIGYRPDYHCKELNYSQFGPDVNSTNFDQLVVTYEKCHVSFYWNTSDGDTLSPQTLGCLNGYQYDTHDDISFVTEWNLVCSGAERAEFSQALVLFGQGVGGFIFTGISDKFGRKPIHLISHIGLFLITLGTAFVPTFVGFAPLRFFTGACVEGLLLTSATQYVETLPLEWRFCAEVVGLLTWTTGIVLLTPFGYFMRDLSWRYVMMALSLISAYSLIEYWLFDESLRWLMANGKLKEAEKVLRKAAKRNNLRYDDVIRTAKEKTKEEEEILLKINKGPDLAIETQSHPQDGEKHLETTLTSEEKTENGNVETRLQTIDKYAVKKYSMLTILKHKRILINSIILWICWITNSLTYYGLTLISSSLSGNRFLNFFLLGAIEYFSAFAEFMLLNRIGRKLTLISLFIVTGLSLLIATLLTSLAGSNVHVATLSTVFAVIGKFGITGAFSTVFLYTSELYPTNLRNAGYGCSSVAARVGGVVAPFSATLVERVRWGPGAIFTSLCAITTVLITFLPETMGHELPTTIEELKTWYRDHSGFKLGEHMKKNKEKLESESEKL